MVERGGFEPSTYGLRVCWSPEDWFNLETKYHLKGGLMFFVASAT
jgi:hypothetical protein